MYAFLVLQATVLLWLSYLCYTTSLVLLPYFMITLIQRKNALFGHLIGDACGVPYEFYDPKDLPHSSHIDMIPPILFDRSHRGTPVGTWSDDGAHVLALVDSLNNQSPLDLDDFGKKLLLWGNHGQYTPDGRVFDIGIQTRYALMRIEDGIHPSKSGAFKETENGNGALMRAIGCLIAPFSTLEELMANSISMGLPTHAHATSIFCCVTYNLMCYFYSQGQGVEEALENALTFIQNNSSQIPGYTVERDRFLAYRAKFRPGKGYVLDTFWSAFECVKNSQSYEECIIKAIKMGFDTDTTACVAGGLFALRENVEIPQKWLYLLKKKEYVLSFVK